MPVISSSNSESDFPESKKVKNNSDTSDSSESSSSENEETSENIPDRIVNESSDSKEGEEDEEEEQCENDIQKVQEVHVGSDTHEYEAQDEEISVEENNDEEQHEQFQSSRPKEIKRKRLQSSKSRRNPWDLNPDLYNIRRSNRAKPIKKPQSSDSGNSDNEDNDEDLLDDLNDLNSDMEDAVLSEESGSEIEFVIHKKTTKKSSRSRPTGKSNSRSRGNKRSSQQKRSEQTFVKRFCTRQNNQSEALNYAESSASDEQAEANFLKDQLNLDSDELAEAEENYLVCFGTFYFVSV
jgi:hypothetical protein